MLVTIWTVQNLFSKGVIADIPNFKVSTVLGTGVTGSDDDGTKATSAKIGSPYDVWLNPSGELFVADYDRYVVRKVSADGIMTRFAGNYITGGSSAGNGGLATGTAMRNVAICGDTANTVMYLMDTSQSSARRLELSSSIITLFAGASGITNNVDGPATSASMSQPTSCAVDTAGDVYINTKYNNLIRKVTISSGIITTVAGVIGSTTFVADGAPATSSPLNGPQQIYLDSTATLYINVRNHFRVRKLDLTSTDKALVTVIGEILRLLENLAI